MRILLLCHSFDALNLETVGPLEPDLIVAPFLKRSFDPCLVCTVH